MKRILIYLTVSLSLLSCNGQTNHSPTVTTRNYVARHHNKLDEINSATEIESILTSIDSNYSNFKVNSKLIFGSGFGNNSGKSCQYYCDSLNVKPWIKNDLDGNGYTDLLVLGNIAPLAVYYPNPDEVDEADKKGDPIVICIMDTGGNVFSVKSITKRSFQDCTFPIVAEIDSNPVILYYSRREPDWVHNDTTRTLKADTLIFKFGDFVEFNATPVNYKIEKIEYSTRPCFGTCPIFDLTINQNRTASYYPRDITSLIDDKKKMSDRKFTTTIDTTNFNLLLSILNYIDFPKLEKGYTVAWTDDQECTLTITYDNGKIKKISDYGKIGTYGLALTYDLLFALRENQQWK